MPVKTERTISIDKRVFLNSPYSISEEILHRMILDSMTTICELSNKIDSMFSEIKKIKNDLS